MQNRVNAIWDAFITGLQSSHIRQRLLENKTLDLAMMINLARAVETSQKSSESYGFTAHPVGSGLSDSTSEHHPELWWEGGPP